MSSDNCSIITENLEKFFGKAVFFEFSFIFKRISWKSAENWLIKIYWINFWIIFLFFFPKSIPIIQLFLSKLLLVEFYVRNYGHIE